PGDEPRGGPAVRAGRRRHRRHRGLDPDRTPAGPASLPAPVIAASANLNSRIQLCPATKGTAWPSPGRPQRRTAAGGPMLSGRPPTHAQRPLCDDGQPVLPQWRPARLLLVTAVHGGDAHVAAVRRGRRFPAIVGLSSAERLI